MNGELVQRLCPFLVVGVLVVSALGAGQTVLGAAFEDRLFGDRFKRISAEEVSALVEKRPDDAQLLYAASGYFDGDRRQALLDKAISLDKRYEAVALTQELSRIPSGGSPERKQGSSSATVSRAAEILARLMVLDPENALPHWFLATQAFGQSKADEGFAQIAEALKKRKFETYDSAHLRAQFHLLDALGRDGILKFSIQAATRLPYLDDGRYLSEKLIERGKQRLSAGDRAGALDDFAGADRLADELLLARPLFTSSEHIAKMIKEKVAQARVELYEAEGDAPGAAGARLEIAALKAYTAQMASTFERDVAMFRTVQLVDDVGVGLRQRLSEEALQAELAKPAPFAGTLDTAAAQFRDFTTSAEFESMMGIWFENLLEVGESVALQKAAEFYRHSSVAQKQERLIEAFGALQKAAEELPKDKDWVCINNLKQVGLAIFMYANDHDNALPGSLKELAGIPGSVNYVTDQAILKCPVSGTPYVYAGKGVKFGADFSTIIAYDDAPVHSGSRHALFVDGHVSSLSEERLLYLLRRQQQPDQPAPDATQ